MKKKSRITKNVLPSNIIKGENLHYQFYDETLRSIVKVYYLQSGTFLHHIVRKQQTVFKQLPF